MTLKILNNSMILYKVKSVILTFLFVAEVKLGHYKFKEEKNGTHITFNN